MGIRIAAETDGEAIARICRLTGLRGDDATGAYGDDAVQSDVYATPYLHHESGFCLVWEEEGTVLGYVLGTTDTRAFQRWFSTEWWPSVWAGREAVTDADRELFALCSDPQRTLIAEVDEYPAHLHIDLLEPVRGGGRGRMLIEACVDLLESRGVPGLHLVMEVANEGALAFYPRVGFTELLRDETIAIFGRRLHPEAGRSTSPPHHD